LTSIPEIPVRAEAGKKQVLRVGDWTKIRRLRRAEQMPIAEIAGDGCYRPRYLNIQRLNYLRTIRHSSARIAGNLIT